MDERLFTLTVEGNELRVLEVRGRVAVDELFVFVVRVVSDEELPLDELLDKTFSLDLRGPAPIEGIVTRAARALTVAGPVWELELGPTAAKLTLGRDSTTWLDLDALAVVKKVLERHGVEAKLRIRSSPPVRPYVVQRRESDWAFVERLLAEEGVHYVFDLGAEGTPLVIADDSASADAVEGDPFPYRPDGGLTAPRDSVQDLEVVDRWAPDKTRLGDWTAATSNRQLEAKHGDGTDEIFDWPGDFADDSAGRRRAATLLESLRRFRKVITGSSGAPRLVAGRVFEIEEGPSLEALFCCAVEYEGRDVQSDAGRPSGLRTRFEAIPASAPYRPARPAPAPAPSISSGRVTGAAGEEIHPERDGRVHVQPYWDRLAKKDDKTTAAVEVAQLPLFDSMIVPRVGMDAIVSFRLGDHARPLFVARLHDGANVPAYPLPANKTRTVWQSATSKADGTVNEIRFEDEKDREQIWIHASKDQRIVIGDAKQVRIGNDHAHQVEANQTVTIEKNASTEVKLDQTVEVSADEAHEVEKDRRVQIQGSESVTVGASRKVEAKGGFDVDVDGDRELTVSAAMEVKADDGIKYEILDAYEATVGAACSWKAAKGLDVVTGKDASTTVAGARTINGQKGIAVVAKGKASETVGAAVVADAVADLTESAKGAFSLTVGGALSTTAPSIEVSADEEIKLVVGGSSITIKKDEIEVKSAALASPGAMIVEKGAKVAHNP